MTGSGDDGDVRTVAVKGPEMSVSGDRERSFTPLTHWQSLEVRLWFFFLVTGHAGS